MTAASASCGDLPTQPAAPLDAVPALTPTKPLHATDDGFSALDSPGSGSWTGGTPSQWDGSVAKSFIGTFHFRTIITVTTSGTICQVPGILHGSDLCWGPQGTSDHQEAIGLLLDHPNAGSGAWFSTVPGPETVMVQDDVSGFREGLNDPQPWGEYYWTCGRYVGISCWGFAGPSNLSFERVPVALTLTSSASGVVPVGTVVSFTAGMDRPTVNGWGVDFSMLAWRWESMGADSAATCATVSGASCARPITAPGTMYVTAYVNGKHQEQSIFIDVPPAPDDGNKLKLTASPQRVPAAGGSVDFTAFPATPTESWGVRGWLFLPDSGAPHSSAACPRESSLRSCTDSITQTGTMRVYGFVPTVPNDSADARVYVGDDGKLKVTGPATFDPAGAPVTFTASVTGAQTFDVTAWAFHDDKGADAGAPDCGDGETCEFLPKSDGWVIASALVDGAAQTDSTHTAAAVSPPPCGGASLTSSKGPSSLRASATCTGEPPLTIEMLRPEMPLPDESFTTLTGENVIKLHAEVSDPARAGEVQWEVTPATEDPMVSGPQEKPANGANSTLTIRAWPENRPDANGPPKWAAMRSCPTNEEKAVCAAHHDPGSWKRKLLAYYLRAYIVDHGTTISTERLLINQHIVDVLRQEYVDFAEPQTPPRDVLTNTMASRHFSLSEILGKSDYAVPEPSLGWFQPVGWIEPALRDGLDAVRDDYGSVISISGGYRNPSHNWLHVRRDQHYQASPTSNHKFGYAADLDSKHSKEVFYALARSGAKAGACMEPPAEFFAANKIAATSMIHDWDHMHVDWIPRGCVASWVKFRDAQLPPTPAR